MAQWSVDYEEAGEQETKCLVLRVLTMRLESLGFVYKQWHMLALMLQSARKI